jgi:catechol 2,3-dioxygenase-like lactoylglutathione lyase family enzyme
VARVTGIAPFFLVADVTRAAEYYRDKLGFRIVGYFFEEPPVFAMVGRDNQIIMLNLMTGERGGSNRAYRAEALDAYLWTDDVAALYYEFRKKRADIVAPPQLRSYGMKELEVRDRDGYVICFGEDVGTGPNR